MYQLSPTDALMLFMESDPTPNQVSLVLILDQSTAPRGQVRFKEIMAKMESAIDYAPNFGCRLVRVPLNIDNPYWYRDPKFDIEFHVRHLALPKPGDWRQLCIQIARLISRTLDPSRPLWEMYVIEGLDRVKGLPKGCFAVVLKMHHAMIDGQGTMALLNAMLDSQPNPRRKQQTEKTRPAYFEAMPSNWSLTAKAIRRLISRPGQFVRFAVETAPTMVRSQLRDAKPKVVAKGVPKTPFNDTITAARVFDAGFYDLEAVKRMRRLEPGATVNDVVLAIVAGALRRYLSAKSALPKETLVASVPISLRSKETAHNPSGNELVPHNVPLCTHIEDPIERLQAICEVMTSTKSYVNAVGAKTMQQVNTALPGALIGTIARASFEIGRMRGKPAVANTVVTNVPGMQKPLYLCGAQVLRMTGGAPPIGTIGLVNSVGSYCGKLMVSIVACRDLFPDPEFYMQCIGESFQEYQQLARQHTKGQRSQAAAVGPKSGKVRPKRQPRRSRG